jgi:nucleoside-diphosphate-sugar epimerase
MRILITGAAGNLGTKLRHHLSRRHRLRLVSLHPGGEAEIQHADLSSWDQRWVDLFEGVDTVVHLAANANHMAAWADLVRPNIDMVLNVYQACVMFAVPRVIFASSNHVLSGYRDSDLPFLSSSAPPCPGNPYGASKLMGEHIGRHFSDRHGISSINVRIGWNLKGSGKIPPSSEEDWHRKMWLSDRDYCHLIDCCIDAPRDLRWAVINGVSNNAGTSWDLCEARDLIGYCPKDDAFDTQNHPES